MCPADRLPERGDALHEPPPARRKHRRIRPLTWVFAAALTPVLLYDVWQTVHDVKQRHAARDYAVAANLRSHASTRPDGASD